MGADSELVIVDLSPRRLAAVRHVGPFEGIGAAFGRLGQWVGGHPGAAVGAPVAVYLDDPATTPADRLRSDAAVPIGDDVVMPGVPGSGVPGVGESRLAGGRYATATHHGPYAGLPGAWGRMMAALAAHGLSVDPTRPCFEVYENDPAGVAPADLVTVLHQPIA